MRGVKRAFLTIFFLLLAIVVVCFVLENQQEVSLSLLGWSAPPLPLAIPVIFSLFMGLLIGPLLVVVAQVRGKRRTVSHQE